MTSVPSSLPRDQCHYRNGVVKGGASFSCQSCSLVSSCTRDHHLKDSQSHRALCISLEQAQLQLDEESQKLELKCHQCFAVQDADHDHFWEWRDIRPYIQARHRLITLLCKISTERSLSLALHHSLDILRLNPGDNLDVRFLVPGITIRLGMDREASEFVRRYRQVSPNCQYAWAHLDMVLPEPQSEEKTVDLASAETLDECVPLPFKSALILLRLRLLFCLRDLENAVLLARTLPLELVWLIRDNLMGGVVASDSELSQEVRAGKSLRGQIVGLEKQLEGMFEAVGTDEPGFWPALLLPAKQCDKAIWSALEQIRDAWVETPGALEWVQERMRLKGL